MKAVLLQVHNHWPRFGKDCFVAGNATVSGDVVAGDAVTIWFQAVIRGDVNPIRIGDMTNIQDGAVVHGSFQGIPTTIGNQVTIGHKAIIHGCTIEDAVLIGMGSIILDEAIIESGCIVGAGAVVLKGMHLKANGLYVGSPAKRVKEISTEQKEMILRSARNYALYPGGYAAGFFQP